MDKSAPPEQPLATTLACYSSPEPGIGAQGEQKSGATGLATYNGNGNGAGAEEGARAAYERWHPLNPYQVRMDLPDLLSEQLF